MHMQTTLVPLADNAAPPTPLAPRLAPARRRSPAVLATTVASATGIAVLLALTANAADTAGFRSQARSRLDASTYEFFAAEIKDRFPRPIAAYAIAEALVTNVTTTAFCPKGKPSCGPNPKCKHNKITARALDLELGRLLFSTAEFAWPKHIPGYPYVGRDTFAAGDRIQISLFAYGTDTTSISKARKVAGASATPGEAALLSVPPEAPATTAVEVLSVQKATDRVRVSETDEASVVEVTSPGGVGKTELRRRTGRWPARVVVTFRYSDAKPFQRLEGFTCMLGPESSAQEVGKDRTQTSHHKDRVEVTALLPDTLRDQPRLTVSWVDAYRR